MMLPYIGDYVQTLQLGKKLIQSDETIKGANGQVQRQILPTNSFYKLISTQLFFFNRYSDQEIPQSEQSDTMDLGDHKFQLVYESASGQFRIFEFI